MSSILDSAFILVRAYPGGASSLAPRMNKRADQLSHEVSRTGTAKFSLEDAELATILSGNWVILNTFADNCGGVVIPKPSLASMGNAMHSIATVAREHAEFVGAAVDAMVDGKVSANEMRAISRELAELITSAQALHANLAALHSLSAP